MNKIENYLATFAILLLMNVSIKATDNQRYQPTDDEITGFSFSEYTTNELSACLKISKSNETNILPHCVNHGLFSDFISYTDHNNQIRNMCILQICMNNLASNEYINIDARKNLNLLTETGKTMAGFSIDYHAYLQKYQNNLRVTQPVVLRILNAVSFCATSTCIAVLHKNGFNKNSTADENITKLNTDSNFKDKIDELEQGLVKNYKAHLEDPQSNGKKKRDVNIHCVYEVCYGQLKYAGYKDDDAFNNHEYFVNNKEDVMKLDDFEFIYAYNEHLQGDQLEKNDKKLCMDCSPKEKEAPSEIHNKKLSNKPILECKLNGTCTEVYVASAADIPDAYVNKNSDKKLSPEKNDKKLCMDSSPKEKCKLKGTSTEVYVAADTSDMKWYVENPQGVIIIENGTLHMKPSEFCLYIIENGLTIP